MTLPPLVNSFPAAMNGSISEEDKKEVGPISRVGQMIGSVVVGGMVGWLGYWILRFTANTEGAVIRPLPYVLAGAGCSAMIETAGLMYDVALYSLGDRQDYKNVDSNASISDRFRQHVWKIVVKAEGIQEDVDVIFSRFFHIRTAKEIRQYSSKTDYYLDEPKFMEVVRESFWVEVHNTIKFSIPQDLSAYGAEALTGTKLLFAHLYTFYAVGFVCMVYMRVNSTYLEIDKEFEKAKAKLELKNTTKAAQDDQNIPNELEEEEVVTDIEENSVLTEKNHSHA